MEEGFKDKVKIIEDGDEMAVDDTRSKSSKVESQLKRFLDIQQRRAQSYGKLKRGFTEYIVGGGDSGYQQLCSEITQEFSDCSKQVLEIESLFLNPDFSRNDLACLLRSVQTHEKQKLHMTVTIQVLKKAGRPSERLVSHEHCKFHRPAEHECVHVHEITEAAGTEEAEADAEYDAAMKEAIRGVQDAVTSINEHLEEVRYELEALKAD